MANLAQKDNGLVRSSGKPGGLTGLLKRTSDKVRNIALAAGGENSFYDNYEEFSQRENGETLATKAAGLESVAYLKHSILLECGLQTSDSLLDFCCGLDTMATYTVPYLKDGLYLGMEVSETALENTRRELLAVGVKENNATWLLESDSDFPLLGDQSVDMISAFTVFTHMQPEETLKFLDGLRRVLRPEGTLLASFLLLEESDFARGLLRTGKTSVQGLPVNLTSRSMVECLVEMAGLHIETWFEHDSEAFEVDPSGLRSKTPFKSFGQSVCVIRK